MNVDLQAIALEKRIETSSGFSPVLPSRTSMRTRSMRTLCVSTTKSANLAITNFPAQPVRMKVHFRLLQQGRSNSLAAAWLTPYPTSMRLRRGPSLPAIEFPYLYLKRFAAFLKPLDGDFGALRTFQNAFLPRGFAKSSLSSVVGHSGRSRPPDLDREDHRYDVASTVRERSQTACRGRFADAT